MRIRKSGCSGNITSVSTCSELQMMKCASLTSRRKLEDLQVTTDALVSVPAPRRSSQVLSVSAALESLNYVSVQRTTQFIPGAIYEGKEFRCFYVR